MKNLINTSMSVQQVRRKIYAINGSASSNSSNQKLIDNFILLTKDCFDVTVLEDLKILPPFDPALTHQHTPDVITVVRDNIAHADGVLICSPEYIFSIPSGLKNLFEWCVSTTIFSDKPTGLITAAASGTKGHEELQLIMSTIMANFTAETTWLIQGVKGKINAAGDIVDDEAKRQLLAFVDSFKNHVEAAILRIAR
jgi:chromate reductase